MSFDLPGIGAALQIIQTQEIAYTNTEVINTQPKVLTWVYLESFVDLLHRVLEYAKYLNGEVEGSRVIVNAHFCKDSPTFSSSHEVIPLLIQLRNLNIKLHFELSNFPLTAITALDLLCTASRHKGEYYITYRHTNKPAFNCKPPTQEC